MTASFILYQNCKLTPDRNFAVDDITQYLSGLSHSLTFTINYFKHQKETSLLIDFEQTNLDLGTYNYNYVKIQNSGGTPIYYFITDKKWRSSHCVEYVLYMDTISTLGWLKLTDKTLIHREHKNRWKIQNSSAYGVIDKTSEGINPLMYKASDETADMSIPPLNHKFYIIFNTANIPSTTDFNDINPLEYHIVADQQLPIYGTYRSINISNTTLFDEGYSYIFSSYANNVIDTTRVIVTDGNTTKSFYVYDELPSLPYNVTLAERVYYFVRIDCIYTNTFNVYYYKARIESDGTIESTTLIDSFIGLNTGSMGFSDWGACLGYKVATTDVENNPIYTANYYFPMATNPDDLIGIETIDRTDPKLVKIIETPYPPLEFSYDGTSYILNYPFTAENYDSGRFWLGVPTSLTSLKAKTRTSCSLGELSNLKKPLSFSINANKNKIYETKLYHSEMYQKSFVYDSFVYNFEFEKCDIPETYDKYSNNSGKLIFDFYTSLAVTSKFLFDFTPSWSLDGGTQNYDYVMTAIRNNEIPIYTNQYLTYLRTGLQYDLKSKNRQEDVTTLQTALTAVGAVTSMAVGLASSNPALMLTAFVGGTTAITSSVVSAVNQSISNTQALEQKQAQLKNQATSVQGSDDLSLLKVYSKGNWGKLVTYRPSKAMRDNLFNLFYYMGYKVEKMGIPNLTSRLRFNFIQADIDVDSTSNQNALRNFGKDLLEDYKARFSVGLTIFHKFNGSFNFDQDLENWETILENYLS